ncbi:poxvirus A22 protein [Sicyoidochytrium minutum DNA virus]|nr:poxvirus A22 protein [Sicyoidochytrium minutum DNA virus]BDC16956.1 hypothetical protein [Sicyoidochytrium minutum DNA virus]
MEIDGNDGAEAQPKPRERLTKGLNVLSWDIGVSNMAYCLMEYTDTAEREFTICFWENMDLRAKRISDATNALIRELDRRRWMLDADHISIESQSKPNTETKVLSHLIQMYFTIKGQFSTKARIEVDPKTNIPVYVPGNLHFISPSSKFKVTSVPDPPNVKPGHRRNKLVAIAMAEKLLRQQRDFTCLHYLHSHSKQDDLSDSMLLALIVLRRLSKKDTEGRARKPRSSRLILQGVEESGIDESNVEEESPDRVTYRCNHGLIDGDAPKFKVEGQELYRAVVYPRKDSAGDNE